jgi:hypothetical protein
MSSPEQSDEPHEEYRYNGEPQQTKKHHTIKKILFIIAGIVAVAITGLTIRFAVLLFGFLGEANTSIPEALNEAWQSILGWTKPITDLYNQTMKLIPGNN